MTWAVVQSNSGTGSGSSTQAVAFTAANVTAGNKIIVFVSVNVSTTTAVTTNTVKDGAGTDWTKIGSFGYGTTKADVSIWALDVPAGDEGTKPTITATFSATCWHSVVIQEVSGLEAGNTTAMVDGTPATLTGQTATTGSPVYSTTAAGGYLVCLYGDNAGQGQTVVKATGWTMVGVNASVNADCLVEYTSSTGGSETNGFTNATTTGFWGLIEVAFQLAAVDPFLGDGIFAARAGPRLNPGREAPTMISGD